MKHTLKRCIPPLLLDLLKGNNNGYPTYPSYAAALATCSERAYENPALINTVIEKNRLYAQHLANNPHFDAGVLKTLIGFGSLPTQHPLHVLDFGGGGGYHYHIAQTALGAARIAQWAVVETPTMAAAGQALATPTLKFFDNLTTAATALPTVDLIFSSCALNYCPNPLAMLRALTAVKAPYLYLTRMPLTQTTEKVIRQSSWLSANGPGQLPPGIADRELSYPNTLMCQADFEALLKENYTIRFRIAEEQNVLIADKEPIHMYGYFCQRH